MSTTRIVDGDIIVHTGWPKSESVEASAPFEADNPYREVHDRIRAALTEKNAENYVGGLTDLLKQMQTEINEQSRGKTGDHDYSFTEWARKTDAFPFQVKAELQKGLDSSRESNTLDNQKLPHFAMNEGFGHDEVAIRRSLQCTQVIANFINTRGGGFISARSLDHQNNSRETKVEREQRSAWTVNTTLHGFNPDAS